MTSTNNWINYDGTSTASYIYVDSATTDSSSYMKWRSPTYEWKQYDAGETLTISDDFSVKGLVVDGDIDAKEFETRIKAEMMEEVQKYITGLIPTIIAMATERWIPILGQAKKYNEGVFCFNCGAAIIRGKEQEECGYCGR